MMNLSETMEKLRKDYHVAGMSAAVIRKGKIEECVGSGIRNVAENLPMTEKTVLPIGSITKSFTTLALGMLVDEGKLSWDTPVKEYIPELRLADPEAEEHAAVRDLLCHRTGVPRYDLQVAYCCSGDKKQMLKSLRYLNGSAPFRTKLQYSNQMVSLAGYLVDVLSGMPYEDFVRERIFRPLGMSRTDFEVDSLKKYGDYSAGYVYASDTYIEPPYLHLGAFNPAGGIVSCAEDMAKYVLFQLGHGPQLVKPETLEEMHTHQVIGSPYFWSFPEVQSAEYGLTWFTDIYRGHRMVSHGGNTNGYSAQLVMLPDEDFGMVVLSNASSTFSVDALGNILADEELGVKEIPDWSARYQKVFADYMGKAMAKIQKRAAEQIPGTHPTKELSEYAGTYEHPGFGKMTFALADGQLTGTWNGLPASLKHYHYDSFDLMLPMLGMPVPAHFEIAENGSVDGLKVWLEMDAPVEPAYFRRIAQKGQSDAV